MPDGEIDLSDIEALDEAFWKNAVRNPFHKPARTATTVLLDSHPRGPGPAGADDEGGRSGPSMRQPTGHTAGAGDRELTGDSPRHPTERGLDPCRSEAVGRRSLPLDTSVVIMSSTDAKS